MKKPIAPLTNNWEHKQLCSGNLLNHFYNTHIEHPEIPIHQLEYFMIQHKKLSFVKISEKQKTQCLKELNLIISKDANYWQKYDNDEKTLIYPSYENFFQNLNNYSKYDIATRLNEEILELWKIKKCLLLQQIDINDDLKYVKHDKLELEQYYQNMESIKNTPKINEK